MSKLKQDILLNYSVDYFIFFYTILLTAHIIIIKVMSIYISWSENDKMYNLENHTY